MKKRMQWSLAVGLLAAVMVTGCSGNNAEAEDKTAEKGGEETIHVLVEAGSPAYDVAEQTAEEFKKMTGVQVVIDAVPYSGLYDKLSAEVTSQAGLYDVACVDTVWLAGLQNGLLPLDEMITEEMKADFPKTLIEDATLDNSIYGLPAWANCKVLLYREDLFNDEEEKEAFQEQYGTELKVPKTWEEYERAAEFFTRDTNEDEVMEMYGTSLSAKTGGDTVVSFLEFAAQAGAKPVVIGANNQILEQEDAYVEALNHMKALYDSQSVPAGIFEMAAADHVKMFSEGKLAMAPVWCAMYSDAVKSETEGVKGNVGVAMMPSGPSGNGVIPAPFYHVILKGSQKQDAAKEYLKFLNEKNELYINRGMAGRISVLEAGQEENPQLKVLLDSIQAEYSGGRPKLVTWNEIESGLNTMIQNVLKGEIDPETAISDMKSEIENML